MNRTIWRNRLRSQLRCLAQTPPCARKADSRPFCFTPRIRSDGEEPPGPLPTPSSIVDRFVKYRPPATTDATSFFQSGAEKARILLLEPYHLHVYGHKHNTHVTFTDPERKIIISASAGNVGFRKAARGTFEAAYQLITRVIAVMNERGHMEKIDKLELILRDFGPGREAMMKILTGSEGTALRAKLSRITDGTRLKFGGTRSRKMRRL